MAVIHYIDVIFVLGYPNSRSNLTFFHIISKKIITVHNWPFTQKWMWWRLHDPSLCVTTSNFQHIQNRITTGFGRLCLTIFAIQNQLHYICPGHIIEHRSKSKLPSHLAFGKWVIGMNHFDYKEPHSLKIIKMTFSKVCVFCCGISIFKKEWLLLFPPHKQYHSKAAPVSVYIHGADRLFCVFK